jgi:hypothetical protein
VARPNYLFLTGRGFEPRSAEEARDAWESGKQFKVYQLGTVLTARDTAKIVAAGASHIGFVFQRDDLSVACLFLELTDYKPPVFKEDE